MWVLVIKKSHNSITFALENSIYINQEPIPSPRYFPRDIFSLKEIKNPLVFSDGSSGLKNPGRKSYECQDIVTLYERYNKPADNTQGRMLRKTADAHPGRRMC